MTAPAVDDLRGLPPILSDIARATSLRVALTLADQVGGQRWYIPNPVPPGHWLEKSVGRAAAMAIADLYPREYVTFPLGAALHSKRAAIARMTGPARDIAAQLRCTERYVYKVRSEIGYRDPDSPGLFDD